MSPKDKLSIIHTDEVIVRHGGAARRPYTLIQLASTVDFPLAGNWYQVAPGDGVRLHKHLTKSELWFVIDGTGSVVLGDYKVEVGPGTVILIPPDVPHALQNDGHEDLIFVSIASPPSQWQTGSSHSLGTIELEEGE